MRTTLRTVDFVEVLERELQLARQALDAVTEVALSKRREFVEKRLDDGRVDDDHEKLETKPLHKLGVKMIMSSRAFRIEGDRKNVQKCHEPRNKAITSPFEDV